MSEQTQTQRPIVALLGEFSAGKSTLVNVLMKGAHSPVRVTATQLPPIWYRYGRGPAIHIARDGTEAPLPGGDLSSAPLADTRAIRVEVEADILLACDLLDMPGSSDPNMTPDIWDALLPLAQSVLWCTPSTQAWRQSEAAIWEEVPEELHERAFLLLTRFDKIRMMEDRKRLLGRVRRETRGLFRSVFPVQLLRALESEEDSEAWADSGMEAVLSGLSDVLEELGGASSRQGQAEIVPLPRAEARDATPIDPSGAGAEAPVSAAQSAPSSGIMPRRVTRAATRTGRPRRASGEGSLI
ncbi:MAG: hypothetical protein AAGA70_07500 [Pseudomonadota bacterium]